LKEGKSNAQQVVKEREADIKQLEIRTHEASSRLENEIGEKQGMREAGRQAVNALNKQIASMEDNEAKLVYALEQVLLSYNKRLKRVKMRLNRMPLN
jgi:predicted  nucleic acid-binding Zn-ribbon protein